MAAVQARLARAKIPTHLNVFRDRSVPVKTPPHRLTIATRESPLALWQAQHVAAQIRALYPKTEVVLLGMTTLGDQILYKTLDKVGGKGLFVKELETALLDGRADLAVHSMKDVPYQLPEDFRLAAIGPREDPRDAFVSNSYAALEDLPEGSRVGTASLRREAQLRARFPSFEIVPVRGNVQTRLMKLDRGDFAGMILASAGLVRLDLEQRIRQRLDVQHSLPAVGQGALGLEVRADRDDLVELLQPLNHSLTAACVTAERAMSRELAGSCSVPLAGFCVEDKGQLWLRGLVASRDGVELVTAEVRGVDAQALGLQVAQQLLDQGAAAILAAAK